MLTDNLHSGAHDGDLDKHPDDGKIRPQMRENGMSFAQSTMELHACTQFGTENWP